MAKREHIALFGGTFDPVHIGHLRSAIEVREALAADELRLLPNHQPPLRGAPGADSRQRLAMVEAAVAPDFWDKTDHGIALTGPECPD